MTAFPTDTQTGANDTRHAPENNPEVVVVLNASPYTRVTLNHADARDYVHSGLYHRLTTADLV